MSAITELTLDLELQDPDCGMISDGFCAHRINVNLSSTEMNLGQLRVSDTPDQCSIIACERTTLDNLNIRRSQMNFLLGL